MSRRRRDILREGEITVSDDQVFQKPILKNSFTIQMQFVQHPYIFLFKWNESLLHAFEGGGVVGTQGVHCTRYYSRTTENGGN